MMTYRRDSKSKVFVYGSIMALCFIAFLILLPYIRHSATLFAEYTGIAHTTLYQKSGQVLMGASLYVRANTALYEELRKAQFENNALQSEVLRLQNYRNIAVRFGLDTDSSERVMTERIGRVDGFLYNSFRVLKRNTVCTNPLALGPYGIFLGTVTETNSYTALVQTAWNGEPVLGQLGSLNIPITLLGEQDGTYIARIPKTTPVQIGEVVTLSARPSITVGSVVFVHENARENQTSVIVKIPFSPQQISVVELFCPYE